MFSPPAWGWSAGHVVGGRRADVLPTRVGMVRSASLRWRPHSSSPHPRGDGPPTSGSATCARRFSPPAWGWSDTPETTPCSRRVLPTRVGMVRPAEQPAAGSVRSPHPRGDGPGAEMVHDAPPMFSPPAWGWSAQHKTMSEQMNVLPTRVGMVRSRWWWRSTRTRSPHPRGDGPYMLEHPGFLDVFSPPAWGWSRDGLVFRDAHKFSPPAWGWSAGTCLATPRCTVLPTRVGMVRPDPALCCAADCSPHPRGDGPCRLQQSYTIWPFSPPAWGWSVMDGETVVGTFVLPTRVGMVRSSGR